MSGPEDLPNLDLSKKKSKKQKVAKTHETNLNARQNLELELSHSNLIDAKTSWPDYTYQELLSFIPGFVIITEAEESKISKKQNFILPVPKVARINSKKTSLTNSLEICSVINRSPKHVHQFLLSEFGTTGSIDGNQNLIIKGRFLPKHFESVLRTYLKEYVICQSCLSYSTEILKEIRLTFVHCKSCGSRRSVRAIENGFKALFT